jgi:uncharacterized protein (DUF1778 family)
MGDVDYTLVREMAWRKQLEAERHIRLSPEDFEEFTRRIDNPPKPNKALVDLLRRKAPWEST